MRGIPDYMSNPNYNPNHSDWYPGKRTQAYRDNYDRIFRTPKEETDVPRKPKPKPC